MKISTMSEKERVSCWRNIDTEWKGTERREQIRSQGHTPLFHCILKRLRLAGYHRTIIPLLSNPEPKTLIVKP